jgi:hypothetical protein
LADRLKSKEKLRSGCRRLMGRSALTTTPEASVTARTGSTVTNTPPEVEVELSEEEFELDETAEDVDIAEVETQDNTDVDTQDPDVAEA